MSIEDDRARQIREGLRGPPADGPHLGDEALAAMAEGRARLGPEQFHHLSHCVECRDVLAVAASVAPQPRRTARAWALALVPALAAAAGLALALRPGPEYVARGHEVSERASVTFLAVAADGATRELAGGDTVSQAERLGFRYGNPTGSARTLTILGWDGARVHWYYPDRAGASALVIEGGPDAISQRLGFDVMLAPDHGPGTLALVAAFDREPDALADALRTGADIGAGALHIEVRLTAP